MAKKTKLEKSWYEDEISGDPNEDLKFWPNDVLQAAVEALDKADDKKLAEIEKQIETEFSEMERKIVTAWVDDYPSEFQKAKKKIEERGGVINELAIRQSYINDRVKWPQGKQLAPEKKEIAEKYLNLKLPASTIENKNLSKNNMAEVKIEKSEDAEPSDASLREKFFKEGTRHKTIEEIAREIYERRTDQNQSRWVKEFEGINLYGDEVDRILRFSGITPGSPKADEFMRKWDWEQAAKIYEKMYGGARKTAEVRDVGKAGISGVKKIEKDALPEEERDPIKAMALHTIAKTPRFEDLNVDTLEKGDKKIIDLARKIWSNFTVHGFPDPDRKDPITGEIPTARQTDLDGRGFLAILKKAGIKFDMKDVDYVKQGDSSKSGKGIVGDTSGEDGIVAKNSGELLIADHHGDKSGRNTSATRNMYEALVEFGMLERSEGLDNFVEFVTKEDNKEYTDEECQKIIGNFDGNLIGLQRYMNGEDVIKIFEEYAQKGNILNPYEKLPDEFLQTLKFAKSNGNEMELKDVLQKLTNTKEALKREVEAIRNEGLFIETSRYGTVLIDTGRLNGKSKKRKKRLGSNLAIEAARAAGCGGVVSWNPDSFSIQTANEIDFELPEGFNYRGHYWLKTPNGEKSKTTLEDILGKLSGQENFQLDENLKAAMEKEKSSKSKELTEEQKILFEELNSKFPFKGVEKNISRDLMSFSEVEKAGRRKIREMALNGAKRALRNIAMNFSAEDAAFFRDNFMDRVLAVYQTEKENVKGIEKIRELRTKHVEFIKEIAAKRGFSEKEVQNISSYFRNIFQIEFLVNNSKQ